MKKQFQYTIQEFSSSINQDLLKQIYKLNQENIPEVGSLSSFEYLQELVKLSSNNFYVSFEDNIIGFIICFRENSEYTSKNYDFFTKKEPKFLYIDRIVIKPQHRRNGVGKRLYSFLDAIAKHNKIPLCCEVNTIPLNEISIRFHQDFGFSQVGKNHFTDHSVVYFQKLYFNKT